MSAHVLFPELQGISEYNFQKINLLNQRFQFDTSISEHTFAEEMVFFSLEICNTEYFKSKIDKLAKIENRKGDFKIWWPGYALPSNEIEETFNHNNVTSLYVLILVDSHVTEEIASNPDFNGWIYCIQSANQKIYQLTEDQIDKVRVARISKEPPILPTPNLQNVNGRTLPIYPEKLYQLKLKAQNAAPMDISRNIPGIIFYF